MINAISEEVVLAAHSLGNMISSEAIRIGASVDKYFAIDAAVASECYENGGFNLNMVHKEWGDFASDGYDKRLYAAYWHELFETIPGDARNELTWEGHFDSAVSDMYNFYSSGEDVLDIHPHTMSPGFWDTGITGQYAWARQEKLKGRMWLSIGGGSTYGGWGFNSAYGTGVYNPDLNVYVVVTSPEQATPENVTDEMLRKTPYFRPGGNETADLYDETDGSSFAYDNKNLLLTAFIPAVSLPAGKIEMPSLNGPAGARNFDMQNYQDGWPYERDNTQFPDRWLHSDIKAIAYPFVWQIYDEISKKGDLE